jgi:predicted cupin superfamily sugar epimerase
MMSIPPRALELIEQLSLIPHPEGGFYKETYRSETTIGTSNRSVMTSIYFLLTHNNCSRFHRIQSDEAWYFHEGDPLQVHTLVDGIHRVFPLGMNFSFDVVRLFFVNGY